MTEKSLVICPGRGSYTKETLNYVKRFSDSGREDIIGFIRRVDDWRREDGYPTITEMDSHPSLSVPLHTPGENASTLISTCALADFLSINREKHKIVGVIGNSMGWYLSLAAAGALDERGAYQVIQTMGAMMKEKIIGGQIIYSLVDEEWRRVPAREALVHSLLQTVNQREGHEAYISIHLGGYVVLAGNDKALGFLLKELPPVDAYPFKLPGHAAFHTPMLDSVSQRAFDALPLSLFQAPKLPLVDGQGKIWMPYSTPLRDLYFYTLGHQVVEPYDFTASLVVALKEFAPTKIILLGPGNTLGGAIGQTLVQMGWQGIRSKKDFVERQKQDPFLIAMGMGEQRPLAI